MQHDLWRQPVVNGKEAVRQRLSEAMALAVSPQASMLVQLKTNAASNSGDESGSGLVVHSLVTRFEKVMSLSYSSEAGLNFCASARVFGLLSRLRAAREHWSKEREPSPKKPTTQRLNRLNPQPKDSTDSTHNPKTQLTRPGPTKLSNGVCVDEAGLVSENLKDPPRSQLQWRTPCRRGPRGRGGSGRGGSSGHARARREAQNPRP
jgi:hypothetical protein